MMKPMLWNNNEYLSHDVNQAEVLALTARMPITVFYASDCSKYYVFKFEMVR